MILSREPVDIGTEEQLIEWVDAAVASLFAWLRRIAGSVRAEAVLPEVYRVTGASSRAGTGRTDAIHTR